MIRRFIIVFEFAQRSRYRRPIPSEARAGNEKIVGLLDLILSCCLPDQTGFVSAVYGGGAPLNPSDLGSLKCRDIIKPNPDFGSVIFASKSKRVANQMICQLINRRLLTFPSTGLTYKNHLVHRRWLSSPESSGWARMTLFHR